MTTLMTQTNATYDCIQDEFVFEDGSTFAQAEPVEETNDRNENNDDNEISEYEDNDLFFNFDGEYQPLSRLGSQEVKPFSHWKPLYYTKPMGKTTIGPMVTDFAAGYMTLSRGYANGEPLNFAAWQRWLVNSVLELDGEGFLRYRRVIIGLPRKNGKSLIGTAIALERVAFGQNGENIYSCATSKEQARLVFDEARKQITANPVLRLLLEVQRDRILNRFTGNFYKVLAADAATAQGLGPSLVIFDEIHALKTGKSEELWSAMTEGSADRREAVVIAITTAGSDYNSLLGKLFQYGQSVSSGEHDDTQFGFFWWGAPDTADVFDPEVWRSSNPNLALGLMNESDFHSSIAQGMMDDGLLASFKRYRLNQWVRTDGGYQFIYPQQLELALTDDAIAMGASVGIGFDGSLNDDSTSLVGICLETGVVEMLGLWESDGTDSWTVPREEVLERVDEIFELYEVQKMFLDSSYFETDAQKWVKEKPKNVVQIIPQSVKRMAGYAATFKHMLINGSIKISKNAKLQEHLLNAILRQNKTIAKETPYSKKKIDASIAAILAVAVKTELELAAMEPVKRKRVYKPSSSW